MRELPKLLKARLQSGSASDLAIWYNPSIWCPSSYTQSGNETNLVQSGAATNLVNLDTTPIWQSGVSMNLAHLTQSQRIGRLVLKHFSECPSKRPLWNQTGPKAPDWAAPEWCQIGK